MQNDTGGLAPVSYRSQILLEIDFAPWKLEIDSLPIFSKAVQLNYVVGCQWSSFPPIGDRKWCC